MLRVKRPLERFLACDQVKFRFAIILLLIADFIFYASTCISAVNLLKVFFCDGAVAKIVTKLATLLCYLSLPISSANISATFEVDTGVVCF